MRRIYRNRAIVDPGEIEDSLQRLKPPGKMKNIDAATALLSRMIERQASIVIVGDFDVDGATSCALACRVLRAFGATRVNYLVPNRFAYGYGLSPEIVDVAAQLQPRCIVTVDNGITSHEGVARAEELGIEVLITDHHLPGESLPDAAAIINPNQPGDESACNNLAGVGVLFYLLSALRSSLRRSGWFSSRGIQEPSMATYLDLVALGTVADMVRLDANNRILVSQGLKRINAGHCVAGIRALLKIAKRRPGRLTASDLGFAVAPRLNAAGRLQEISLGVECLLTDDDQLAVDLAGQLDQLNGERRSLESKMQAQAFSILEQLDQEPKKSDRPGYVIYDATWHQGITGLVASKVKERVERPVIALAPGEQGELKGSARSIQGIHIRDLLDRIQTLHPGIMIKFGGHAMAAGLTLLPARLEAFRSAFTEELQALLGSEERIAEVQTDGVLASGDLNLGFADTLRLGGPWGQGFPEPLFDGVFQVSDQRVVGEKHLKLKLLTEDQSKELDAICFRFLDPGQRPPRLQRIKVAYRLDINEFRGKRSPQMIVDYLEEIA